MVAVIKQVNIQDNTAHLEMGVIYSRMWLY